MGKCRDWHDLVMTWRIHSESGSPYTSGHVSSQSGFQPHLAGGIWGSRERIKAKHSHCSPSATWKHRFPSEVLFLQALPLPTRLPVPWWGAVLSKMHCGR